MTTSNAFRGWFMFSDNPIIRTLDQRATLCGTAEAFTITDPDLGTITIVHSVDDSSKLNEWYVALRKDNITRTKSFTTIYGVVDYLATWVNACDVIVPRYMFDLMDDLVK